MGIAAEDEDQFVSLRTKAFPPHQRHYPGMGLLLGPFLTFIYEVWLEPISCNRF
ncbi:hypothetical protein Bwad005_08460 [Bilophila wadsworthia]